MRGLNIRTITPFAVIGAMMALGIAILFLMPTLGVSMLGLKSGNFSLPILVMIGGVILLPAVYAVLRKVL